MATATYKINRFHPSELPDTGVIMFVGRSGSGKTFAMRDIIYSKRHFDTALGIFGSEDTSADFRGILPDLFIHDKWDEKIMEEIYNKQERDVRLGRAKKLLLIVDDMMHSKNLLKSSKTMQRIFFSGRHARILLLLTMQYCKSMPPDLRQQVGFTFLTYEKLIGNRKRIFDTFNNVFDSFTEFDGVMKAITPDFTILVLSNVFNTSDDISKNVFWYKAKQRKAYKIGKNGPMWKVQQRLYDNMYFIR
jgi:hypothetical protein